MNHHLKAYNFAIERMSIASELAKSRTSDGLFYKNQAPPYYRQLAATYLKAACFYQNEAARWYKVAELHKSQYVRYEAYHSVDRNAYYSANGHYVV